MFTHLHVHTEYSLLDGVSRIRPMLERAKALGMDSLAITDHGNMHGAIEFYLAAREMGVKPIVGCELYVAPASRHEKTRGDKSPYHLTVLAKDLRGYKNLCHLITRSHLEGFYYRPRVDRELLERYRDGLIVLSGCLTGEVQRLITEGRVEDARKAALWHKEVFEDYYLEIQRHEGMHQLETVNQSVVDLSRETGIPLVATNDFHYVNREDAPIQDILICIHTNTNIEDEKRLKMDGDSYYLKSPEEMEALFEDLPEAISNTQAIVEKCNLELEFGKLRLPEYRPPQGRDTEEYLVSLCWEGLKRRFRTVTPEMERRLSYELDVIKKTQFANYFLVVWDIATFARENKILFGVRGSAAASLVLYCLGVSDIDPIEYGLVFERFLNIERKEMPDIDMDFQDDRREEVTNYLVRTYGQDNVAQIVTFGTLGAKAAIRDAGRALAMSYSDVDRVARLIPFRLNMTLDDAMEESPELREIYEADDSLRNLVDTARRLEGLARHVSTHAAGVVISKAPLVEYTPLQRPVRGAEGGVSMTQYAMGDIAKLGLLKMDILGLVNLTILDRAVKLVAENRGVIIDLQSIPLDDDKTFALLSSGYTANVFQLESAGMRRYITDLKPSSLGDVSAMIALYRPGPMEHISTFTEAKHGRAPIKFPHEAMREILEETYGVIVYQDQVLIIAQRFAGYSLGEADIVRKAMGKKIPEVMRQERDRFVKGALAQSYTEELASQVFELIEPFAGYAFNKAHSMSYALISYWTAYFKANYTVEYMTAVLNSYSGNTDKVASTIAECRRLRIRVLPPDVNRSEVGFAIEKGSDGQEGIRLGLAAVKNVGEGAVRLILREREVGGAFKGIEDLCARADLSGLNKRTMESLIKVGAFDSLGDRGALLASVERILSMATREAKLKQSGQSSMFDLFGDSVPTPLGTMELAQAEEVLSREKLQWEKELLGVYLSENPISIVSYQANTEDIVFKDQLDANMKKVHLVGQVVSTSRRYTKDQRTFLIANLALMDGEVEVAVWPREMELSEGLWQEGNFLRVVGRVRVRNDQITISCDEAREYRMPSLEASPEDVSVVADLPPEPQVERIPSSQPQPPPPTTDATEPETFMTYSKRRLKLQLKETEDPVQDAYLLKDLVTLMLDYRGEDPVKLEITTNGRRVEMDLSIVNVNCCQELVERLEEMMGYSGVVIEGVSR